VPLEMPFLYIASTGMFVPSDMFTLSVQPGPITWIDGGGIFSPSGPISVDLELNPAYKTTYGTWAVTVDLRFAYAEERTEGCNLVPNQDWTTEFTFINIAPCSSTMCAFCAPMPPKCWCVGPDAGPSAGSPGSGASGTGSVSAGGNVTAN